MPDETTQPTAATIPPCDLCGAVQTVNGAVLWGPPNGARMSAKWHVCVKCYPKVTHPEPVKPPRGLACMTCHGSRVMCYRDMKAVPCEYTNEAHCPNTGHHTCPECF